MILDILIRLRGFDVKVDSYVDFDGQNDGYMILDIQVYIPHDFRSLG